MIQLHELQSLSRRPERRWIEDGLVNIGSGVFFLVLAGFQWAAYASKPFLMAAMSCVMLALTLLQPRALRLLKERLVFPRAGSMVLKEREVTWAWIAVVGVACSSLAVLVIVRPAAFFRLGPTVLGSVLTAAFLATWWRLDLRRYLLLGFVSAAVTTALEAFGIRQHGGFLLLSLVLGAAQLLTGAVVLLSFLRATPFATQD